MITDPRLSDVAEQLETTGGAAEVYDGEWRLVYLTSQFRFFAGDGEWTLRTLAPKAQPVDTRVVAATGSVAEVQVLVTA